MIDFRIEPELQAKLDWMAKFVREECEPMDMLFPGHGAPYDVANKESRAYMAPLQAQVKAQGLWACHLGAELGGPGYGQSDARADERDFGPQLLGADGVRYRRA